MGRTNVALPKEYFLEVVLIIILKFSFEECFRYFMPEYKKNHTIPRFMLEYWIDVNTEHKGVHVYDVNSQRYYISTSQGRKAFSFAIINNLYIHDSYNKRAVGLEKWFSQQEQALSTLISQAHKRQTIQPISSMESTKLLMALTGLEYRSNYVLKKLLEAIENNEIDREKISANPERPSKQLLLENIVHLVTEQHLKFIPTEMFIAFAPENCNFLLSDRPFINYEELEYRFVVLTNKIVLGYRRSTQDTIDYIDLRKDFFELINEKIAFNAREWLIACSEKELKKYSTVFNTKDWEQSVKEDKVIFKPIKFLCGGWTIDR